MSTRIQLRVLRCKPEGAIVVARPSKWGNPFVVGENVPREGRMYLVDPVHPHRNEILRSLYSFDKVFVRDAEQAVDAYAWWLIEQPHLMVALDELSGHDLACWCPVGKPCHADVLLELAEEVPA